MEQAILKEIFPEQHRKNFRFRNVLFQIEGGDRPRFVVAKVTGNAVGYIEKLEVGQEVSIAYPGEGNDHKRITVFLMNDSQFKDGRWFSECRLWKCYLNGFDKE